MADISFSVTPSGGQIDKYVVQLYNAAGTIMLDSKTYVPTFPSTIDDSFTGLTSGTTYKVRAVEYIGTFSKTCPFQSIVASGGTPIDTVLVTYGYCEADTTGAPLTEGEYITSIEDAITAGESVFTMFITSGDNIGIPDFANPSDKVLFIKLPSTENAFLKWSEVGNIYQQNIAIDQTFSGSGVIFRSVQGANTYYITRSQTDFAGELDLTR